MMVLMKYDVIVIGGGVIGTAILRELSRYDLKIALLEKGEDVCSLTSKSNSAIVHAGYDAESGTLKAKMNVRGNELIRKLSKELDFSYRNNGSLVLCFEKEKTGELEKLYQRGLSNGVKDMTILSGDEAREMEPTLSKEVVAALYAKSAGIVCPFEMTIAFAENAIQNGADVFCNTEAKTVRRTKDGFLINEKYECTALVNAAGLYGDLIHDQLCEDKMIILPRKGDYCIFDKEVGGTLEKTIFQLPGQYGKGVLVTPTIHGNLMIGPSASDVVDKEMSATTKKDLDYVIASAKRSVPALPMNKVITSFCGVRARTERNDFIIEEAADNYFEALGIESPGLSSAPAIGEYLSEMVASKLNAKKKEDFIAVRKGLVHLNALSKEERGEMIKNNPLYGNIICRCEEISEGEIVDAIHRPLPALSMDAIKRRVRAGMGRCQGGFCSVKVMEILSRELQIPMEEVKKNSGESYQLLSGTKTL